MIYENLQLKQQLTDKCAFLSIKVILGTLAVCIFFLFYIDVLQAPKIRNLYNSKGPLKIFLFSFEFGNYAVPLIQIISVFSPQTHQLFLQLITILSYNQPVKRSRHRNKQSHLILINMAVPSLTLLYFETASFLSKGYKQSLLNRWSSVAAPFHYPRFIKSYSEMSLGMIFLTVVLELVMFIRNLFFASAMSLLLMASLTFQHVSNKFLLTIRAEIWLTNKTVVSSFMYGKVAEVDL